MHIDNLTISPIPADCRRNNDECIFVHKIPYASLILRAVARVCDKVEFQGLRERNDDKQDKEELDNRRVSGAGRSHVRGYGHSSASQGTQGYCAS